MSFWRRPFKYRSGDAQADTSVGSFTNEAEVRDGDLRFVAEKGGNDSPESYQEASGAPVEVNSPLGYTVGPVTIIFLNVSMMIGTGVYSTPSTILKDTGSVGLSLIFWFIGLLTSIASLVVYLEFAAYFPNRSGSEVVYLEQAFPRPRWLFPTAFAFQSVALSFSSGNAIVLAEYLYETNGATPTAWGLKGVAMAGYTVATLIVCFNTKFSYYFSNAVGAVKVLTLLFISITGLVVLGGHAPRVPEPRTDFIDAFAGTTNSPYGLTNALYKVIFAYSGYTNAFNVVNEVKNPIRQMRRNGYISLGVVTVLYILANIAYFAAVSKDQLEKSSQIAASLFFKNVFGESNAVKGLNILIALSSFGNLIAVLLGTSRVIRECGRQGVLPWPRFWASTKPLGTPLGPYFVKWFLTIVMILAPPAGDAFNFITDLQTYPSAFFGLLMAVGLYFVRWRRHRLGLPRPAFRAWDPIIVFNILVNAFLLVMPWYPPASGPYGGDVSFWYATYVVTGIGLLIACAVYYFFWIDIIPRLKGYRIRQEVLSLGDGAQSHTLAKVPVAELAAWDAAHDAVGRCLGGAVVGDGSGGVLEGGEKTSLSEEVGVVRVQDGAGEKGRVA